MKIGVVVDNEFTHDIRVNNECLLLAKEGHEVVVLALNYSNKPSDEYVSDNIHVKRISINRGLKNILFALCNTIDVYSFWWSRKIKRLIESENVEVLHVHDLYMSKSAYRATSKFKINFNLDLHENYPAAVTGYEWMNKFPNRLIVRPGLWKKKEKKYLQHPKNIIVLSEQFRDILLNDYKFLKKDQFVVYPNVPDLEEFNTYRIDDNILEKKEGDFILFYFGTISRRRGIFIVLEALEELVKIDQKLKLLLIGPVDKAEKVEFEKRMKKPSIIDHITYYPWKDISLLPSYITISDVCLSPIIKNPQHESGVANKVFQYMLFEKPLIVSNCTPQAEIVLKEDCGLVFKWNSSNDFAKNVLLIYKDKNLANKLGQNGKKAVLSKYNSQLYGEKLFRLYDNN